MKTINITDKFQGYIWMSDKSSPRVVSALSEELKLDDSSNPFIVEAQLFDTQNQISYSVKYVDGKHLCKDYPLAAMGDEYTDKEFISNRIDGVSKLKFRQYWREEKDELCENMKVLLPSEFVFVGFKTKED